MGEERHDAERPAGPQVAAADWLLEEAPPDAVPEPTALPPLRRGEKLPPELCFADGTPNPYAVFAENRRRADHHFLAMFAITSDHAESASATCGIYGHDSRAGRCLRCGLGVRGG